MNATSYESAGGLRWDGSEAVFFKKEKGLRDFP
jgi:hypothetical protein